MQPDSIYLSNDKGILFIKDEIQKCFAEKMNFKLERINLNHHGWFVLQYLYIPKNYIITFESEFNGFDINIVNDDGGYISLMRLSNYNKNLTCKNVREATKKLYTVLKQEISFYKIINDKLYKQVDGKYKKVKDWREL